MVTYFQALLALSQFFPECLSIPTRNFAVNKKDNDDREMRISFMSIVGAQTLQREKAPYIVILAKIAQRIYA